MVEREFGTKREGVKRSFHPLPFRESFSSPFSPQTGGLRIVYCFVITDSMHNTFLPL